MFSWINVIIISDNKHTKDKKSFPLLEPNLVSIDQMKYAIISPWLGMIEYVCLEYLWCITFKFLDVFLSLLLGL